jgi:hypothetical protein
VTTPKSLDHGPVELELHMPRVVLALEAAVVVAMVVVIITQDFLGRDAFSLLFPLFLAAIVVVNTARVLSRVRAHADGFLEVRNSFRTRTLQRTDIDRVMVGQEGGLGSARRLELLLTDGQVLPIIATERPPLPGSRQRLEEQGEQLRAWAAGTPTPYR